jgi:hypothetical protein
MQREFIRFVEQPSGDAYLAARDALLRAEPQTLTAIDLEEFEHLLGLRLHDEVLERLAALPASAALSPRVHLFAAEAADGLGDQERVELERFLFVVALQGILATGDGSKKRPYVVCHATDEHDVLEALDRSAERQTLVQGKAEVLDVIECTGGGEVWFDITVAAGMPMRRRQARKPRIARSKARPRVSRTPR